MLDTRLFAVVKQGDGQYTRYADDLSFSFPIYSDREKRLLKKIFSAISSEDYEIQKKKRVRIQRSHQRQTTTGLIVNEKVNLPRKMRRRIRSLQHHRANKTLSDKDLKRLRGYEGLLNMIKKVNGVINSSTNMVSTPSLSALDDTDLLYLDEKKEVYISYAWGGESEKIVNEIAQAFQNRSMIITRDKQSVGYKGSIKEFMKRIGRGKCVVVVISDKYLKSKNCMFELLQIAENKQFVDRIFPVVLSDAGIYDAINRIGYIKFWEDKITKLDAAMKTVGSANLQGIREEIDLFDILQDMNTLTPGMHRDSDFQILYDSVIAKLEE